MKFLFFTDLHIHHAWIDRSRDFLVFLAEVIKRQKIDIAFHLGDVFEEKDRVTNIAKKLLKDFLSSINIPVYWLVGNHDFRITDVTTLELLDYVIKEPLSLEFGGYNFFFLPYGKRLTCDVKCDFFIFHDAIKGLRLPNGYEFKDGVDLSNVQADYYLAGHVHTPGKYHDVLYLGSPIERDFRDSVSTPEKVIKRGCYIFDTTSEDLLFTEFKSLRFVKADVGGKRDVKQVISLLKTNFIDKGYSVMLWLNQTKKFSLPEIDRSIFYNVVVTSAVSDEDANAPVMVSHEFKTVIKQFLPKRKPKRFYELGKTVFSEVGLKL